jgi:hypothetical protein
VSEEETNMRSDSDFSDLHVGKLTEECKTTVTESFLELLKVRARQARCTPADLMRDSMYLVFTGKTFTSHVANDRSKAMLHQGRHESDKSPCKPEVNGVEK